MPVSRFLLQGGGVFAPVCVSFVSNFLCIYYYLIILFDISSNCILFFTFRRKVCSIGISLQNQKGEN